MLSAIDRDIRRASTDTFAGGTAGFTDIAKAAHDAALYVDNTDGWYRSLDAAYDRRIEAVRLATGRTIENPLRAAEAEDRARMVAPRPNIYSGPIEAAPETYSAANPPPSVQRARQRFEAELRSIADQFPEMAGSLGLDRSIEDDALAIAREADERLGIFSQSASGPRKWAALFSGGASGMMRDPVQVTTMLIGAGAGAGRTVAGRIANVAVKEALINGAVEAALQPAVQEWRERAGLPSGFDEAARNVAFATGLGGLFGAVLQGGGEAIGRALRGRLDGAALEAEAARAAEEPGVSERVKAALEGDTQAARAELETIREALPAEARGALDHADGIEAIDAQRPPAADPDLHDRAVARAVDAAQQDRPGQMPVNPEQANRIAEQLAPLPERAAGTNKKPKDLTDFLIRAGGVIDQNGEVMAVTGNVRVARKGKGTLVRPDGMDLDSARLLVAEAGYMDRLYGTPDEAMAQSTVADLLSLMDEDLRGNRVLAGNDVADPDLAASVDIERSRIARDVTEVQELIGPALDDSVLIRALEIARDEGLDLDEAAERAVMELPEPGAEISESDWFAKWEYKEDGVTIYRLSVDSFQRVAKQHDAENSLAFEVDGIVRVSPEVRTLHPYDRSRIINHEKGHALQDIYTEKAGERAFSVDALDEMTAASRIFRAEHWDMARFRGQAFLEYLEDPEELFADAYGLWRTNRHKAEEVAPNVSTLLRKHFPVDNGERNGAPLPGWSDEELDALASQREPDFDTGGIDDPAAVPDWDAADEAAELELATQMADDELIPGDNGELVTARQMLDDIDDAETQIALVEACRT